MENAKGPATMRSFLGVLQGLAFVSHSNERYRVSRQTKMKAVVSKIWNAIAET
jgi:hypothetical protein